MKLYNRTEFMKLPEGTIFAKGKPWYFEDLSVKGETIKGSDGNNIDWAERGLVWIEAINDEDQTNKLEGMLEDGLSGDIQISYGRDGCFDKEDLFLVYEYDDLMELQDIIDTALRKTEANVRP